jgi:DNA-binding transcriptional MerR regulator
VPTITSNDLFLLQGSDATITPTELGEFLRHFGRAVSRRTMSFWQGEGLIPPAMRVGQRGGVYPFAIVDLTFFIADAKDRGASLETIRELLPLWKHLAGAQASGHISVADFEHEARLLNLSREANYLVPFLVEHATLGLCETCIAALEWETKDGLRRSAADGLVLKFAIGEVSPADGLGDLIAWTQLTLPGIGDEPDLDDPALVVLGLPNGISVRRPCCAESAPAEHKRPTARVCRVRNNRRTQKEVLPLPAFT